MIWLAGMMGLFAVGSMVLDFDEEDTDETAEEGTQTAQGDPGLVETDQQVDLLTGQPMNDDSPGIPTPTGQGPESEAGPEEGDGLPPSSADTVQYGPDQIILGSDQDDDIQGGSGDDQLNGAEGDDVMAGGAGGDRLQGADGNDTLLGGGGDDILRGGEGDDQAKGDSGGDHLFGYGGDDALSGGTGDDTLEGGQGADILLGGSGQDGLMGGHGDDTLDGGDGADTLFGGWGNDTLTGVEQGAQAVDFLNGGGGDDTIVAGTGDCVTSGEGSDLVILGDWLSGGSAAEILDFSVEEDRLALGWDLTHDPDPEIAVETNPDMPGQASLMVNGTLVAILNCDTPPDAGDILIVDHAQLSQLNIGSL